MIRIKHQSFKNRKTQSKQTMTCLKIRIDSILFIKPFCFCSTFMIVFVISIIAATKQSRRELQTNCELIAKTSTLKELTIMTQSFTQGEFNFVALLSFLKKTSLKQQKVHGRNRLERYDARPSQVCIWLVTLSLPLRKHSGVASSSTRAFKVCESRTLAATAAMWMVVCGSNWLRKSRETRHHWQNSRSSRVIE